MFKFYQAKNNMEEWWKEFNIFQIVVILKWLSLFIYLKMMLINKEENNQMFFTSYQVSLALMNKQEQNLIYKCLLKNIILL